MWHTNGHLYYAIILSLFTFCEDNRGLSRVRCKAACYFHDGHNLVALVRKWRTEAIRWCRDFVIEIVAVIANYREGRATPEGLSGALGPQHIAALLVTMFHLYDEVLLSHR